MTPPSCEAWAAIARRFAARCRATSSSVACWFRLVEHRIGRQYPAPDRVGQMQHARLARGGCGDRVGGLVVAVRVVLPGAEQGAASPVLQRAHDSFDRCVEDLARSRRGCVAQSEEADPIRRQAERRDRVPCLRLTQGAQLRRRAGARARMRPGAIGHDEDVRHKALRACFGDEAAAAEALVVGMRGEDERCAAAQDRRQRREGQRRHAAQRVSRQHHALARPWAPASSSTASGAGWRR